LANRGLTAALALGIAACSGAATSPPAVATPAPAGPTLSLTIDGKRIGVPVTLDAATVNPADDHDARVLARLRKGNLAIVLDSYASKPQSMSRCQAGRERWLRVIDVVAAHERYAKLVESCLKDVVPGDPLLIGPNVTGGYIIHLLSEPSLRIAADGTVEVVQ
jgi:hypothetical protein